ncbi:MAG: YraN family protein [Chloroflexota bacterium]
MSSAVAAMPSISPPVGAGLALRLASVATAMQRLRSLAVPVESVPSAWRPVGVMAPASLAVDHPPVLDPSHARAAATGAAVPGPVAVAAAVAIAAAPSARPGTRRGQPRSIKSGPPKAPRVRAAPAAPVTLPIEAVPVMAPTEPAETPVAAPAEPDAALGTSAAFVPLEAALTERIEVPPLVAAVIAPPPEAAVPETAPRLWPADKPRVIDPGHSPGVERASSTLAQRLGDDAERLAAIRLEALGWRIVARNLRLSRAEIDLLAIDPAEPANLVIVEVRRRSRRDFGLAEETVDFRKRAALRRAAGELAIRPTLPDGRRLPNLPVRVDLVAIDRGPDGRPSWRHHRGIEV